MSDSRLLLYSDTTVTSRQSSNGAELDVNFGETAARIVGRLRCALYLIGPVGALLEMLFS
jgi:hypothetical protein